MQYYCPNCKNKIAIPEGYKTESVKCPACKESFPVNHLLEHLPVEKMGVKVKCSACGQVQEVPDEYVGKKIQCNVCKKEIIAELPQRENLLKQRPHLILSLVAAVMLFAAIWDMPHDYYKLLRLVVCVAAIIVAFVGYKEKQLWMTSIFVVVALIFNPVLPVELAKEFWLPIDIICGILFGIVAMPWKLLWLVCVVLVGVAFLGGFLANENKRQAKQWQAQMRADQQEKPMESDKTFSQTPTLDFMATHPRTMNAGKTFSETPTYYPEGYTPIASTVQRQTEQEQALKQAERERQAKQIQAERKEWQEATKRLVVGMTKEEVRSICGVPKETSANELGETWHYSHGRVIFKRYTTGDRLSSWW